MLTERRRMMGLLSMLACLWALPGVAQEWRAPMAPGRGGEWTALDGVWGMGPGWFEQRAATGLAKAFLPEATYADTDLSVDFHIRGEGAGVRAAAVMVRATGTLTYYWLHVDARNSQLILTRSTPQNPWIEIARARGCPIATDVWHTLAVQAHGPEIVVTLDGREWLRASDGALTKGCVGLGTSQGAVIFANLTLRGERIVMSEGLKQEGPLYQRISVGEAAGSYQAFPDMCRAGNGDLIAVFYGGYGHVSLPTAEWPRGGRICMVRSSDEGRSWSEPRVLYDGVEDDRDPHIARLSDGRLVCSFFKYEDAGAGAEFWSMLVWSDDDGRTWTQEAQPVSPRHWACSAPVRELADGTLLLGIYTERGGPSYGGVTRSTDGGATWSPPIGIDPDSGVQLDAETDIIQRRDGSLFAALRSSVVNMHAATSTDGGLTWSAVYDLGFPGHAPHLLRLSTGAVLMGHRLPGTSVHVSDDDCNTWRGPYQIDSYGGAYPAAVELRDGTVGMVYYEEGEGSAVRYVRLRVTGDGAEVLDPKG